jgi:hypothetical protein
MSFYGLAQPLQGYTTKMSKGAYFTLLSLFWNFFVIYFRKLSDQGEV